MAAGSVTFIADGLLTPQIPSSSESSDNLLPLSLSCLQKYVVSVSEGARHIDAHVLARCWPDLKVPALPVGQISYTADSDQPVDPGDVWLRADPVMMTPGPKGTSLHCLVPDDLSLDEFDRVSTVIQDVLAYHGYVFLAPEPNRWYLRLNEIPDAKFLPPFEAGDRGVVDSLPSGPESRKWIGLMNECQMALHENSSAAGEPNSATLAVSSVWFWGTSRESAPTQPQFDRIFGSHALARGIGVTSDRFKLGLPDHAISDRILISIDEAADRARIDSLTDWIRECWSCGTIDILTIIDPRVGEVSLTRRSASHQEFGGGSFDFGENAVRRERVISKIATGRQNDRYSSPATPRKSNGSPVEVQMSVSRPLEKKQIERRNSTGNVTGKHRGISELHPVLARVYGTRSLTIDKELELSLSKLCKPDSLLGLDAAVDLLSEAIMADARILIVGDFDADGACASAVAVLGLRQMGAQQVAYLVPNRFDYGYGLTPEIVELAAGSEPDVIVTVDNGISSIDGVARAQEFGISVLITDHHLPGDELPAAEAVVNPNQPGDRFPSKNLAGVGVMFYVLSALRTHFDRMGWFTESGIKKPNLADLLDLVALGTVADLVPLDYNNRILIDQGLKRIRAGRCRPGIIALLEAGKRSPEEVFASDLGFAVAPRLNAAGRLDDMRIGIECLLAETMEAAKPLAETLDQFNLERRKLESGMQEQAESALNRLADNSPSEGLPIGLCIFDADWHHGIVGLVASRMRERFDRPVVAFAPASDTELKGSARSVPGLHIRDLLERISTQNPDLIDRFGGHAMAAGLSLKPANFESFNEQWEAEVRQTLGATHQPGTVMTDGSLDNQDLNIELADQLRRAGPWGQGFPEPQFDGQFLVENAKIVGETHVKMNLRSEDGEKLWDAIAFRFGDRFDEILNTERLHIVYRLGVNNYRGNRTMQLVVEHMQPVD